MRSFKALAVILFLLCAAPALAVAVKFIEPGSDATQGLEFYANTGLTSSTDIALTGPRVIKGQYGTNTFAQTPAGILADAGNRFSLRFQKAGNPGATGDGPIACAQTSGGGSVYCLRIDSAGVLKVSPNEISASTKSGSTLSNTTTYRISFAHTITTTTNFTIKVFVNGILDITATNADFSLSGTGVNKLMIGNTNGNTGAANVFYLDDIYVDDGATLDDPGDIRVTAKLPAANNTGSFTDSFGIAAPANRYTNADDRPLSAATGWSNDTTTANGENYTLEAAGVGDVDVSAATLVARSAWVYARKGQNSGADNTGTCNVTGTNTGCTTTAFTVFPGQTVLCGLASNTAVAAEAISDSLANTWTALAGPTTSTVKLNVWQAQIGAGTKAGSMTVSSSYTSATVKTALGCAAFDGLEAAAPLDKNPANAVDGTSQYDGTTTGTLTNANETVVGVFAWAGPSGDTTACAGSTATSAVTAGTTGGGATSNANLRICYATVAATTAIVPSATDTTANRAGVQSTSSWKIRSNVAPGAGTPKITDNGIDTALTLTTANALYSLVTTSASYPSNVAGIGMVASGATASTVFYEGGTLIAYIPAAGGGAASCNGYLGMMGVGC